MSLHFERFMKEEHPEYYHEMKDEYRKKHGASGITLLLVVISLVFLVRGYLNQETQFIWMGIIGLVSGLGMMFLDSVHATKTKEVE